MYKLLILLFFIPFELTTGYHQLTWDDFKGKPTDSNFLAVSRSGWDYWEHWADNGSADYSVRGLFFPELSFSITTDSYTLKHEQGHFDINEIYVRRLNKQLKLFVRANDRPAAMKAQTKMWAERCITENLYDKETRCALDHTAQERWNIWILEQLKIN